MASDPEQQLYIDVADLKGKVPKLQNEVKSTKKQLTKLSNRIESLELLAFQEQISSLNDKINLIDEMVIEVSRVVAMTEIEDLRLHMEKAIAGSQSTPSNKQLSQYLTVECTKARTQVCSSPKPLSILYEYRKK